MALGVKAAGAGLGLVVTLLAFVGLSVVAPVPERGAEKGPTVAAKPERDAAADAQAALAIREPGAVQAEAPPVAAAQPEPLAVETPTRPDTEAAALPDLPVPSVVGTAPNVADAPPASTATAQDLADLAIDSARFSRPAAVPQTSLPATAPLRDAQPEPGPLPPALDQPVPAEQADVAEAAPVADQPAPAEQADAAAAAPAPDQPARAEQADAAAAAPAPDQPAPAEQADAAAAAPAPDQPAPAEQADAAAAAPAPAQSAPVVATLPGRPVAGLPGQPVRRPVPEPDTAVTDLAPRPAEGAQDDSALIRNAVLIQPAPDRPLMALVLADPGLALEDRLALAARPLPFTVALNPMDPSASEAAALYLENGKEVFMTASGLPAGATASDVEVTFSAHFAALPQAAGVIDLPRDGFTRNAVLMGDVMQVVARDGYGLVTFAGGLGNPGRAAEAAGIRHAEVFRVLDTAEDSPFTIRRFLDRAVFQGTQMGQVVVYGEASNPGLLQALDMWQSEGRVDQVAVVPVSAILLAE